MSVIKNEVTIQILEVGTQGPPGPPGVTPDLTNYYTRNEVDAVVAASTDTFVYNQASASTSWVITHNLDKYPSVTVVDTGGTVIIGAVSYDGPNKVILNFTSPFSGKAYLN